MKDFVSRYGEWALIAGAAEGIGSAFSTTLAGYGMNLILSDKNIASLDLLADELEKTHGIKTIRLHQDLAEENASSDCLDIVNEIDFRFMIYVPAFSPVGKFTEYSEEEIDYFLSLNVRTPVHLVHSFLKRMQKGQPYGIILMSSLAGMLGPALAAPYAATKAFSIIFSESLFYELKDDRVDILACCAGPTSTPTYWKSNPGNQSKIIEIMQPLDVATYALKMLGKKPFCIPGWKNRLFYYFLIRIIPRKIAGILVSRSMVKMYPDR
jgi:short-subunit dehydrogenase